jgi:hypothetical protein
MDAKSVSRAAYHSQKLIENYHHRQYTTIINVLIIEHLTQQIYCDISIDLGSMIFTSRYCSPLLLSGGAV